MVWEIILQCQTLSITLTAVHILGCDNVEADHFSHHNGDYSLPAAVHRMFSEPGDSTLLLDLWGIPILNTFNPIHIVDLFTTMLNNKVEALYSRLSDPLALQGNPLQVDWSQGLLYMYRPPPLLSLALHKVIREKAPIIAIIPWWPKKGWFPLVLQLLVDLLMVLS